MSSTDWAFLAGLTSASFANGAHRTNFPPACQSVGATGLDVSNYATQVAGYYALISALYASMLAVSGGTLAAGTDQLSTPRRNLLGSAAFADIEQINAPLVTTQDATYQILPQDFGNMLRATSGTRTWTLPAASDLPDRAPPLLIKNRSGSNLTINRSGSDTIDAAATSLTVATGASIKIIKASATTWESYL